MRWITYAWLELLNGTRAEDIRSRIGTLVYMRTRRKTIITEKDFAKCAFGKELISLTSETNQIEINLTPRTAESATINYETEYGFN